MRITDGDKSDERGLLGQLPGRARMLVDCLFCAWNLFSAGATLAQDDEELGARVHDAAGGIDNAPLVALADEVRAARITDEQMFGLTGWHAAEWASTAPFA